MKIRFVKGSFFVILFAACALQAQRAAESQGSAVTATDSVESQRVTKDPRGAMIRSVLVPGWGQFYNEKWFKGIIIAGAECGLVANAIVQNQFAVHAKTTLDREFYVNNRNLSYWWLAGVILYSAIDAYVDAHLFDFDESPNLTFNVGPSSAFADGPRLFSWTITYRF